MEDIHPSKNRSGWYPELVSPGSILFYPYPCPSLSVWQVKEIVTGNATNTPRMGPTSEGKRETTTNNFQAVNFSPMLSYRRNASQAQIVPEGGNIG